MKSPILFAVAATAAAAVFAPSVSATPRGAEALPLTLVAGGSLADPVVAGDLVYVPSGRIVSTWDYSNPAAPRQLAATGTTPTDGMIRGLTRWGDYLYASWQAGDDSGGVAVYSLRDPRRPELVNQFSDYAPEYKSLWTLAAANGYLYLFDSENGIFYGDLGPDPLHPTFTRLLRTPVPYDRATVAGDRLFASGTTYSSTPLHACIAIDVSVPGAPVFQNAGCGSGDSLELFRSRIQPPLSAAYGLKLSLFDVSDPAATATLGAIDIEPATDGFVSGDHAYSLGFAGIDIHDISDRMAPVTVGHSPIPTLGADSVTPLPAGALVLTSTDRFTRLDVSNPLQPVAVGTATPVGGAVANDVAIVGGKAVILQENYGLGIADRSTLAPLARFDADLPEMLNQRDFEQFAVEGNRAYLVAWGYGLVIADLSDPLHPVELAKLPYGYPSAVAAGGNFIYLGTATNGGVMQVVDVSDAANPVFRGALNVTTINRLQVHGRYVYAADDLVGVHVIDVGNPDAPVEVGVWNDGCTDTLGRAASDIDINAEGTLAVVACGTGMHLLDLSRPASPVRVGGYEIDYWTAGPTVTLRGDRAWFADALGLIEFDIADPAMPVELGRTTMGYIPPRRLRSTDDGRLFAFSYLTGLHVFGTASTGEPDDRLFADGFDGGATSDDVSTYDDLPEGFLGTSYTYNGVTYSEVNGIGGVFPDGSTFEPSDVGDRLVVENVGLFHADFPDFGSAPNALTFGDVFIDGENFSIGALVRARMDLDRPADAVGFDFAYYENGPWGGIEIHLDAYRNGVLVGGDQLTIADGGGRDNVATAKLEVAGVEFDALKLYATWNGQPSAPRIMIDDLRLTRTPR